MKEIVLIDGGTEGIKPDEGQECRPLQWKPIALLFAGLLSACATVPATVTTTLTTAQQHAQQAIDLYQISKGIAQVAELADPALIPFVSGAIAVADPIVAKAQTALTDASTDAAALEALVAQITTQADSLTVGSASVIKVVPSSPAG